MLIDETLYHVLFKFIFGKCFNVITQLFMSVNQNMKCKVYLSKLMAQSVRLMAPGSPVSLSDISPCTLVRLHPHSTLATNLWTWAEYVNNKLGNFENRLEQLLYQVRSKVQQIQILVVQIDLLNFNLNPKIYKRTIYTQTNSNMIFT